MIEGMDSSTLMWCSQATGIGLLDHTTYSKQFCKRALSEAMFRNISALTSFTFYHNGAALMSEY